jgi:cyclophilin family peptidyl-prolyl cis-trans isomerase
MYKIVSTVFIFILAFSAPALKGQTKKPVKKAPVALSKPKHKTKPDTVAASIKTLAAKIKITTSLGDIVVLLYDKTPRHRDNFIKLVNDHFYDSTLFHRVINGFMMQGGDPNSKHAAAGAFLGDGDVGYTIPAEFDSALYHKRGVLAAARTDNPAKASSGCQFYIVQGKKTTDSELDVISMQNGTYFSAAKRMTYKMNGGTPKLDMKYTVFGEVLTGMDVADAILMEQTDENNRPLRNIFMKMEVMKEEIK